MRITTGILIVAVLFVAALLALNWHLLTLPTDFYFLFGTVTGPMGFLIVGLLVFVSLVASIYVGVWQHLMLADYRRQSLELNTQRELAEAAETSRLTTLSTDLRDQFSTLEGQFRTEIGKLGSKLRDSERSLAALIAELDDRVQSSTRPP